MMANEININTIHRKFDEQSNCDGVGQGGTIKSRQASNILFYGRDYGVQGKEFLWLSSIDVSFSLSQDS